MRNVIVDIDTLSGSSFTIEDSVAPNAGGTAYTQLRNNEDVHSFFDNGGLIEVYIPFHSIASATVTYEEVDDPSDNICEEGPSIDCTKVSWKGSSDLEVFDPISEGDTIQINLSGAGFYFICSPDDGTTLVEPTYTCDMASATFEYENDELHFEPTQTGTAHITLDYMGCKISFTVEVV